MQHGGYSARMRKWGGKFASIRTSSIRTKMRPIYVRMKVDGGYQGHLDWDLLSHQYFLVNFDAYQGGMLRFGQKCWHTVVTAAYCCIFAAY